MRLTTPLPDLSRPFTSFLDAPHVKEASLSWSQKLHHILSEVGSNESLTSQLQERTYPFAGKNYQAKKFSKNRFGTVKQTRPLLGLNTDDDLRADLNNNFSFMHNFIIYCKKERGEFLFPISNFNDIQPSRKTVTGFPQIAIECEGTCRK